MKCRKGCDAGVEERKRNRKPKASNEIWMIPIMLAIFGMIMIALSPASSMIRIIATAMAGTACAVIGVLYYVYRKE